MSLVGPGFTPTFEEYVWSHVKAPWERFFAMDPRTPWEDQETIDYRTEKLFYHNIDMALALGGFAYHAYRVGGYAATNNLHFYRIMQSMQRLHWVVTNPGISIPLALSVGAALGWASTADQHGAVTPGVASGFGMPITNPGAAHSPTPYRQGLRDMFGLN